MKLTFYDKIAIFSMAFTTHQYSSLDKEHKATLKKIKNSLTVLQLEACINHKEVGTVLKELTK